MREPVERRRQRILDAVRTRGTARVADLAAELGVSVVTVRRDVEELARLGELRRGHGVVRGTVPAGDGPAQAVRGVPGGHPGGGAGAGGTADTVGLVVPERHSYLFEAVHGARAALEAAGVRMALHIAPYAAGSERAMAQRALADGVRGLLVAPRWRRAADERADQEWLSRLPVPAVLMERRAAPGSPLHAMDSVRSDHWYGVHLALDHLTGLGHRRIVLAARDDSPTARTIRSAFARIAAERPDVEHAAAVLSTPAAAAEPAPPGAEAEGPDLAAVLRAHGATAAVLHGDVDALILVQRLQDAGWKVPGDCSVVAYDDVVAALGGTPLTAVAPPKEEIGRAAAELLLRRLRHPSGARPEAVRRLELLPELKVRGSTAPRG